MLLVFGSTTTFADTGFKFNKDDMEFGQELAKRSRQITLLEMQEQWLELQNMLRDKNTQNIGSNQSMTDFGNDLNWGTSLRIFVSSSMSRDLLKSYAREAKNYGAVLVFNGLPDGSWHKLSELVTEISGNDPDLIAMQIDDQAFNEFNITSVPSFVLAKEEDIFSENPKVIFDKVSGSIGIRRVLETFAQRGQLQDIAQYRLDEGEEHE